ncbi:MAG: hypothetical protein Q7S17_03015 [Xanthobacteraceae bacterium]|nr:hypothetical protein [Xanthobacteraceae bacterium]
MRIRVETRAGQAGAETPHRFCFDGRDVKIAEVLDEWPGADYRYFKVRGEDGNLYILRLDEPRAEWELTMFQVPMAGARAATDSQ